MIICLSYGLSVVLSFYLTKDVLQESETDRRGERDDLLDLLYCWTEQSNQASLNNNPACLQKQLDTDIHTHTHLTAKIEE